MTAINARRLGLTSPWYRPVGIALASIVLDELLDAWWGRGYFRSLGLYLGTVWALWSVELEGQMKVLRSQRNSDVSEGSWLVPGIAGAPLALLAFLAFVVTPLMPLEPREVCERLIHAKSPSEVKNYATLRLQPALAAISKLEEEQGDFDYELIGEEEAPANVGGYLVAYRLASRAQGRTETMNWLFHLVSIDDRWRVDDIYFTAVDDQAFDEPVSIAANYPQLVQAASLDQLKKRTSTTKGAKTDWWDTAKKTPVIGWIFGWKILAAIVVGAGAWLSSFSKPTKTKEIKHG